MNKKIYLLTYGFFLFLFILFFSSIISIAQEQNNTWAKIYGSLKYDAAISVIKTSSGDYLIGGVTDRGVDKAGYFLRDIDFNDIKKVKMSVLQIESQNIDIQAKEGNYSWQDVEFVISNGDLSGKIIPKPELELVLSDRGSVLTSNLPIFVKENEVGNIDIDSDGDGIAQEWENKAMEFINPYIELDEEEDWLIRRDVLHVVLADRNSSIVIPPLMEDLSKEELEKHGGSGVITTATDHVANFVRVHPYPDLSNKPDSSYHSMNLPKFIIFRYVVTWSFDYGRYGITEHVGDHERIFMAWKIIDNKTLKLEWVFTSSHKNPNAHHGVWNAWYSMCNKGHVALSGKKTFHSEVMCSNLHFDKNRLVFYASEDKHAIYPSCDVCENVNLFLDMVGEDCGGGGRFMFDCYNVGEPPNFINPRVYDLTLNKEKLGEALPNEFLNKLLSRYRIQIKTGNKKLAGTDAKISIKLFGSDGNSPWYEIYSNPKPPHSKIVEHLGTFKKGDTDNIYINSTDLGDLNKIQIKHNNRGLGPGWYISEIWVEDLENNEIWHSQPNTWLERKMLHDNTDKTFDLDS